jgi:hypothetical protein
MNPSQKPLATLCQQFTMTNDIYSEQDLRRHLNEDCLISRNLFQFAIEYSLSLTQAMKLYQNYCDKFVLPINLFKYTFDTCIRYAFDISSCKLTLDAIEEDIKKQTVEHSSNSLRVSISLKCIVCNYNIHRGERFATNPQAVCQFGCECFCKGKSFHINCLQKALLMRQKCPLCMKNIVSSTDTRYIIDICMRVQRMLLFKFIPRNEWIDFSNFRREVNLREIIVDIHETRTQVCFEQANVLKELLAMPNSIPNNSVIVRIVIAFNLMIDELNRSHKNITGSKKLVDPLQHFTKADQTLTARRIIAKITLFLGYFYPFIQFP